MRWEISVSPDAWSDLYEALHYLAENEPEFLVNAMVEHRCYLCRKMREEQMTDDDRCGDPRCEDFIASTKKFYEGLPRDILAQTVCDTIVEHRSCSYGGHNVYIDGAGRYQIPWDVIEQYARKYRGEE